MDSRQQILKSLQAITGQKEIHLDVPERGEFGDYSSNVALQLKANSEKQKAKSEKGKPLSFQPSTFGSPRNLAEYIKSQLEKDDELLKVVGKIEIAGPGFINFFLKTDALLNNLIQIVSEDEKYGREDLLKNKKIMVEFAHPNTHKELHIGHMRTLILGESLSRIFLASGAEVFRANYQGDIGPHVAKAIWGTRKLLNDKGLTWEKAEKMDIYQKAHLLGEGYVLGNKEYEANKAEIDALNTNLYNKVPEVLSDYKRTRKWSLDYYEAFYKRFDVKYDKLYFETEVGITGRDIVLRNIGKVFENSEGAVVFKGEKYGLHTRVFVTKDGNPTYEAKDMALAPMQFSDFPFDKNIHVVANEQKGYFEVVLKALELIDPKFKGREYHLPMGMVQMVGQKMSSRTGVLVTVDNLLEDIKSQVTQLIVKEVGNKDEVAEIITVGAVKYSMLKVHPTSDVIFNIKETISLEGNSGPYLQYTYARTQSVLAKSKAKESFGSAQDKQEGEQTKKLLPGDYSLVPEEYAILRCYLHFPEVVESAAANYAPNLICNYLYDLAQKFNTFYNAHKIIQSSKVKTQNENANMKNITAARSEAEDSQQYNSKTIENFRLKLTEATGVVLKTGLSLLGIQAPEKM